VGVAPGRVHDKEPLVLTHSLGIALGTLKMIRIED